MSRRQTADADRGRVRAPAADPRPSHDPDHLRERVQLLAAELRREHSMRATAQILGTSRETALSLLAGEPVQRGTIALVLQRLDSGEIDRSRRALAGAA
jgi:hypothetical protein